MAKDKKSFVLYCDQQGVFNKLPDQIAGKLIKHIFSFVNDENPICDDLLIEIAFEPIKQSLKRDLKKYEHYIDKQAINGAKGGRPRKEEETQKTQPFFLKPKKPDSVSDSVSDNDIIIIGNEPSQGELQYTHFAWKHFQDPLEYYMTQAERDKLDFLINYNYYYETVKVDRYLKVKEFYADVLDARKILINGGFAYGELSPGDQITLLRNEDQSGDNVAITNAFVNIDKLFVSDPVASGNGFLSYNASTKEFTIGSSTISSADVENAVGSLVKISPSTYGFIFNQTDPLDKFLQIDDVYINNLINLVIQNELILTNAFTDNTYNDVLIQIKDASAYSPYDLRELEDTDVRYNYKINGNHQYLYRELNQEIQYDPLLGTAFGDL